MISATVGLYVFALILFIHGGAATVIGNSSTVVIRVDPDSGVDGPSCLPPNQTHSCRDLSYALRSYKADSVTYELKAVSSNKHYLDNNGTEDVFVSVRDVALVSSSASEAVLVDVHCIPGAGLAFEGSSNILISNVRFLNCGALRNSTSRDFSKQDTLSLLQFNVSLYFYQCVSVTLDRVAVVNSSSATGVVMYDTIGINNILHSNFSGNPIPTSKSHRLSVVGGGGFAVEFTYCSPGDNSCNFRSQSNKNATYLFDNCTFEENRAHGQRGDHFNGAFLYPVKDKHQAFGRGGGLSLYFQGDAFNNSVILRNCCFLHNHADWGGGLMIEFNDVSMQNTVEIQHTNFSNNHAVFENSFGTGGGAVRISSYTNQAQQGSSDFTGNGVTFTGCAFNDNIAWNGGGISLSLALQRMDASQLTNITIENCTFEENHARLGSAVEVALFPMFRGGNLGRITLSDCVFSANIIEKGGFDKAKSYYSAGIGTVYSNQVSLSFNSSTYFDNNSGTPIAIAGATLHVENCNATFINNTGRTGGAIALLGAAHMVVSNGTTLRFFENNATEYGGAIYNNYIGLEDMQSYVNCFIQYDIELVPPEKWEAEFVFRGNFAGLLGNSIFSTSILPCAWSSMRGLIEVQKIFHWNDDKWNYCGRNISEISSEQHSFNITQDTTVQVFPGQTVRLNISALNELGDDITSQTVYSAAIKDSKLVNVSVKPEYTYISAGYFAVTGEDNNVTLGLNTFGAQNWHLDIKVDVLKCPPAMSTKIITEDQSSMNNSNTRSGNTTIDTVCACMSSMMFNNKVQCSADPEFFSTIIRNSYWIGKLEENSTDNELIVGECPYLYCHTNDKDDYITLPQKVEDLEEQLCRKQNRSGVLCGVCIEGYSSAVNSYQFPCVYCNSTNGTNIGRNVVIYLLTSYLPIVLFLILIICCNIRLTTGPLNAYIFFAQVISVNFIDIPIVYDAAHEKSHQAYGFLYGIFNLNFISYLLEPFCVYENFNTLDILLLQYAVAAFPLVMIVIVIVVIRLTDCCSCRCGARSKWVTLANSSASAGQNVGVALVHALVAFLLLSYSKFCEASTLILTTTAVYNANGASQGYPRSYLAGQYSLSDAKYLLHYCLPSVIVFACVAVPPLLLLGPLNWFNNRATKYRCLRRVWPQDKVHIILDTFQGCFRPKMRFYSGVYFLFRLALFICVAFTRNFFQQYVIQQMFLTILVAMLALFQPYRKALYNRIDTLVIANLCFINALSLFVVSSETTEIPAIVFYLQNLLIYIPIICFFCYLTLVILNKSKLKVWLKLKAKVVARFSNNGSDIQALLTTNEYARPSYEALSDDSVLLERANEPNTFRPAPSSTQSEVGREKMGSDYVTPNSDSSGIHSGATTRSKTYDESPTATN